MLYLYVLRVCCAQVICAGSLDTFQIFVWATKTGRLLDVLAAHEAPVVALAFSPAQPLLASGSWDKTVRTWDVFRCSAAAFHCQIQNYAHGLQNLMIQVEDNF